MKIKNLVCIGLLLVFFATVIPNARIASAATVEYSPGKAIVGVTAITADNLAVIQAKGGVVVETIPQINALVVQVAVGKETAFVQNVKSLAFVKYAEVDGVYQAAYTPNDPMYAQQWNMPIISADDAWDVHKGTMDVTVAIVDTGVDYLHNDLAAHYVAGGYDWVNNDANPRDDNGHGTHVAGIAGAIMDNSIGVVGVAQIGIWTEKVLNAGGSGYWDDLAQGIVHATDSGIVKVISMSLGGTAPSASVGQAVTYAWSHGLVLVAAAGNYGLNIDTNPFYPASYPEVIAVSATNSLDQKASWSNYGNKIEVAAPGDGVLSTWPGNQYNTLSGTSMACPHVSGLAALIWSYNSTMTNQDVRNRLHIGVDDLGTPGKDMNFGYGRINAFKALVPPKPVAIEHTYSFSIGPGGSWSTSSTMSDDRFGMTTGTGRVDKFVMTVTAASHIHLELGAQAAGDTIALLKTATKSWSATAPSMVILDGNIGAGTYTFYVGYVFPNNGAFPATYDISITGS